MPRTTCYAISFLVKVIRCIIFPSYLMVTESYRSNEYNIHMFGTIIVCSIDQIFLVYLYTGVYSAGREGNECIRYAVCPNHNLYRTHHMFVSNIRNTIYCKLKYISSYHILHNIQHTTYILYKKTKYFMLYSMQHTVYYSVAPIRSCKIYCRAHSILYYAYTMLYTITVQYNVQHTTFGTSCNTLYNILQHLQVVHTCNTMQHATLCTAYNILHNTLYNTMYKIQNVEHHANTLHYYVTPIASSSRYWRAFNMMHAQCMQDNVQHTVQYNAQNTTYNDVEHHATRSTLFCSTYSKLYNIIQTIHHYVQYTAYYSK